MLFYAVWERNRAYMSILHPSKCVVTVRPMWPQRDTRSTVSRTNVSSKPSIFRWILLKMESYYVLLCRPMPYSSFHSFHWVFSPSAIRDLGADALQPRAAQRVLHWLEGSKSKGPKGSPGSPGISGAFGDSIVRDTMLYVAFGCFWCHGFCFLVYPWVLGWSENESLHSWSKILRL